MHEVSHSRVYVGPVPVVDATRAEVVAELVRLHQEGHGARVATANADFVALARRDGQLCKDLEGSSLVVADGAPIVWLARAAGARRVERLAGADLPPRLIGALRRSGPVSVAIYGSTPDIASTAAERLVDGAPNVSVGPIICPPFGHQLPSEIAADAAAIGAACPDVVLVALGCPRQERFIAEHFISAPRAVWIGIGGSLDFYAGRRRRAPQWAQTYGLEWFVRLMQEPRRLWRRYLLRDLSTLITTAPRCVAAGVRVRLGS